MAVKLDLSTIHLGELEDFFIQVQNPWFEMVALDYKTWFPSSTRKFRKCLYVAYYSVKRGDIYATTTRKPGTISYIARNLQWYTNVSAHDFFHLPDFRYLHKDPVVLNYIKSWGTDWIGNIVLTDEPVALKRPIPKGTTPPNLLTGKYPNIPRFLNADTTDDLI